MYWMMEMNQSVDEELFKEIEKIKAMVEKIHYSIDDVEEFIRNNLHGMKQMIKEDAKVIQLR